MSLRRIKNLKKVLTKTKEKFAPAVRGVKLVFGTKSMFIHLAIACAVVVIGFLLKLSRGDWAAVVICVFAVFSAEAFNTSVEKLSDKVAPKRNDKIRDIKDISAGAVLISTAGALITGLIVFVPYIIDLIRGLVNAG